MATPPAIERDSLAGRIAALLFSGLFAVAFGGVGLFMGAWPLLQTATAAWQVRTWQPVQALVLRSELVSRADGEGGTVYRVQAEYAYDVDGRHYVGRRVGLESDSQADNLGDWHETWHDRLRQAQSSATPVTAWVNPQRPHEAVLDRELRWSLAAFRLPFAVLFSAVGAGAAWVFVAILLGRTNPLRRTPADVGATHAPANVAVPPLPGGHAALWLFGVVWCLFSLPFAVGFWHRAGFGRWFALAAFALGGLIVMAAARATLRARRLRAARVSSVPGRVNTGEPVRLQLSLPASARTALFRGDASGHPASVMLRLGLHHIDDSGSSRDTRMLWDQTCQSPVQDLPDGSARCSGDFSLPAGAPPSGAIRQNERVQWLLEVLDRQLRRIAAFEIVVHQGEQRTAHAGSIVPIATMNWTERATWKAEYPVPPLREGELAPALPETVRVHEDAIGWRLVFRRRMARALALLAALGVLALLSQALAPPGSGHPMSFASPAWRIAACAVLLALALHLASTRWTVLVSDAGLHIVRGSWLWPRLRHVPDGQVRGIVHRLAYTTGGGMTGTEHHALWLKTREPGDIRLSPALAHALNARAVAWHLHDALTHRRGRFAPGTPRDADGASGSLRTPAWLQALAWLAWVTLVAAMGRWLMVGAGA